jgi:hypothetical protein
MPCDGAWSADKISVFQHWIESGMASSAHNGDLPVLAFRPAHGNDDLPPVSAPDVHAERDEVCLAIQMSWENRHIGNPVSELR